MKNKPNAVSCGLSVLTATVAVVLAGTSPSRRCSPTMCRPWTFLRTTGEINMQTNKTTSKSNHQQVTNQTKQKTRKDGKDVKHIFTGFNLIGAFALLFLAVSCT